MNTFLRMMAVVIVAGLGYIRAPNSVDYQSALLMILPVVAAAFYVSLFNMRKRYQKSLILRFLAQGGVFTGGNDKIINQGLIWANTSSGVLTVNPSSFQNSGTLRASDGGTLRIKTLQFTDTGTREEITGGKILVGP